MTSRTSRFWRPRFSLWALLVLITVIAIPLSYVAQRRGWNLRRAEACERLGNHGAMFHMLAAPEAYVQLGVFSKWWSSLLEEFSPSQLTCIEIYCDFHDSSDPIGNSELLRLLGYFPEVKELIIYDCKFTDQELKELSCLNELRSLNILGGDQVCGDFLKSFPGSCKLESISFHNSSKLIADKLRPLTRLRNLKEVQVWGCEGITKESIQNIGFPSIVRVIFEP